MAIRDFDFKQFLLQKGERVGVGLAGFVAVALIITSLFWPGRGLFSGSPGANASSLKSKAASVHQRQMTATPQDADKPSKDESLATKLAEQFNVERFDLGPLQVASMFEPNALDTSRRLSPVVFLPEEAKATVVGAQLRVHIFNNNYQNILVLKDKSGNVGGTAPGAAEPGMGGMGKGGRGGSSSMMMMMQRMRTGAAAGPGGPGGPGGADAPGGGRNMGMLMGGGNVRNYMGGLGQGVGFEAQRKQDMATEFVPLNKLGENPGVQFAEKTLPIHEAIIVMAFPYKKQLEEFQRKLHLPSVYDVLQEAAIDPEDVNSSQPSFRFLGLAVQRRVVDATGKPVDVRKSKDKDGWEDLDLNSKFRPYVLLSARRVETDDPKLDALSFNGLVMPRLLQMREGMYPKIEEDLDKIKETIKSLENKNVETIAAPSSFKVDDFDVFTKGAGTQGDPASMGMGMGGPMGGMMGKGGLAPGSAPGGAGANVGGAGPPSSMGMMRMMMGRMRFGGKGGGLRGDVEPGMTMPGPGGAAGAGAAGAGFMSNEPGALPEYCLVRLVDVDVEPGKIYQYRLQVRMGNPNFGRRDVANPNSAKEKELRSENWYVVPQNVFVPPETLYYLVDQEKIEKDDKGKKARYRGPNAGAIPQANQAVFQIHKWLDFISGGNKRDPVPVGEWSVLERTFVYRGEYVARDQKVDVPYWRTTVADWVLATDPGARVGDKRVPVHFGNERNEAVLVDFEGGTNLSYEKTVGKKEDRTDPTKLVDVTALVKDSAAQEAVVLSPEGKLLGLNSVLDSEEYKEPKEGEKVEETTQKLTRGQERDKRLKEWRERIKEVKEGRTSDKNVMPLGPGGEGRGGSGS
jgi:hypothetical protein